MKEVACSPDNEQDDSDNGETDDEKLCAYKIKLKKKAQVIDFTLFLHILLLLKNFNCFSTTLVSLSYFGYLVIMTYNRHFKSLTVSIK